MRIALVFSKFPPMEDGGADYLKHLASSLSSLGHSVSVFTSSELKEENKDYQVKPVVKDWRIPLFSSQSSWNILKSEILKFKPDVIEVIYPDSVLRDNYQIPYILGFLDKSIPVVSLFFSFSSSSSNLISKFGIFTLLVKSKRVLVHSEDLISRLKKWFPIIKDNIMLVPVGNNLDGISFNKISKFEARHKYKLQNDLFYISFYGALDPSKGADILLKAFSLVLEKDASFRLIFIGGRTKYFSEYPNEIEKMIEEFGIKKYVNFTGYLEKEDLIGYLSATDICALPFKRNVLGRSSLVTALALGIPTITTRLVEDSAFLKDHENVILVGPNNERALANAILILRDDVQLREKISCGAIELSKKFSWEQIALSTLNVFREIKPNVN